MINYDGSNKPVTRGQVAMALALLRFPFNEEILKAIHEGDIMALVIAIDKLFDA